ncbi:hypothetical protein [Vibrio parahaemolyticus]|uniref:hypothetical protein n=1 Tax=Vibrio parahaemolyticus TaxID=670 RepID=UPI0004A468DD|nr:hypothetical protein [Vibrio parahaemolyticus]EGR0214082.1 hypothetical protein [Vibrio parahaemolyticus]EGR2274772.1 hypothetical protein [Vibrio parahaemolyticus]EIV8646513.1 hypothetical protein [Vibrio parahaemolyticus]EIV8675419.1 hypothetical protein [Vibrio parahaemolyticus]EJC7121651.1 hypothetical protein [Vibrio parahaemolyticus]
MTFGDLDSILLDLLSSLFIAITASYISVKLAMRKFKSEKWWDKKLHCYTEITELLSMVIIYADMVIDVERDGVEHDSAAYSSQESAFNEAIIKLQKHGHSSAILLDDNSYQAVLSFANELFRVETSSIDIQKLAGLRENAENCLSIIGENARKALGVSP